MVGEDFSFAWVPLGLQIFFVNPSADLTIKIKVPSAGPCELYYYVNMGVYKNCMLGIN